MTKQINEQIEILRKHASGGEVNLDFIALHASRLSQLAYHGLVGQCANRGAGVVGKAEERRQEFTSLESADPGAPATSAYRSHHLLR